MVVYQQGGENKCYTICPYCYNNPPFENAPKNMGCNQCPHPTCKFSRNNNQVRPPLARRAPPGLTAVPPHPGQAG